MTATIDSVHVEVEGSARILRGCLVPFGQPTIVGDRGPTGDVILYRELFDSASFTEFPKTSIPLLTSHDESRPIGLIRKMWHGNGGLEVEAELIGSSGELEGIRERVARGLMAGLSVGFLSDQRADVWEQPSTPSGLPTVTRRGVRIREGSICVWPAYAGACVRGIKNRTENQLKSDRILGEYRARKDAERAEVEQFLAEQRAVRQRRHEESERIKREVAELRQVSERVDAGIANRRRRSHW